MVSLGSGIFILTASYASLSDFTTAPVTLVDSWVASGAMKNKVSFKACPYALIQYAWIDFGSTTAYTDCGAGSGPIVTTISPIKSYLTLNVVNIYVGGDRILLPAVFQTKDYSQIGGDIKAWSILDSCSASIFCLTQQSTSQK